jgi:hypothetical protein
LAQVTITQLPQAQSLTGTESVPISQNGQTVQTTVGAIANSPTQQQSFITVNQEVTLPNSRSLQGGTGVGLTDTGSLGTISVILNGASGSLETSTNGMIAKIDGSTVVGRTLTGSSTGVVVTNGDGVAGNPVISLTGPVGSINGLAGSGLLVLQNGSSVGSVQIAGTANEIDVADGNGLSGNPTIGLADNPVIPGTGGVVLPVGTTAQRPSGTSGQIRYNSTTNKFEGYQNGLWQDIGNGSGTVTSVDVSGGLTGLTTSGGPVTSSGTITLGGTLAADHGGTGYSSYTVGDLLYANTVSGFAKLGIGANSYVLTSSGSAPSWTNPASITVGNATNAVNATTATTATNVADGAANRIVYQQSSGSTTFVVAPTVTDTFLKWTGSAFQWSAISGSGTVTSVDVSGGTTGLTTSGGPITTSGSITLAGTLNVANGGTGATSLTGYVKGTGSSALTASATIPNTDITGLGTMSTQAASSVAITGGNINGTTIGGTTPGAGTFTSVAMTTGTISTAPTNPNDIVNRAYADSIASGINFHQSCKYATTTALPAVTYANGTGGVGATLTANANGALTVDGYTFTSPADNGTRILIKNQAATLQNGVYTLSQAGDAGNPFILIRATDFDTAGTGVDQIDQGDFFLITLGTANANTSWVQQTPLPIIVGTTGIVFSQFGAPLTYSAGTGLNESPAYTFNIATTGVSAGNYGGAATAVTLSINAQGQITSATDASIAISGSQITSGTVGSSYISGSYTGITGVGTLTAGTWNATTIGVAYGGTGLTTYANGDLIYASGATTLSKLAIGTLGQVLTAGASAPQYVDQSTLSVGSAATATTAGSVANAATFNDSGLGVTSGTTFDGSAARTISYNTIGAPSVSGTNATGTWSISVTGSAGSATNATNVAVTADSTNASRYLGFYSATSGNLGTLVDAELTYNPSTNTLTTGTVVATAGISGGTF